MSIVPSPPANATPTARGLMSAADKSKLDGLSASPVSAVTQANGLTLTAGDLAMGAAGAAAPGAVTTGAQEFGGAKTLTGTILNGVSTIAEAVTSLVRAVGASLVLRSSLGAGASDVAVKVGTSETDAGTNASAKLLSVRTGLGGTEVEYFSVTPKAAAFGALLNVNLGSGTHRRLMNITGVGAGDCNMVWSLGSGDFRVGPNVNGIYATHRTLALMVNGNVDAPTAIEGIKLESAQNPTRVVVRIYAPAAQSAAIQAWRVGTTDVMLADSTGRLDQSGTDSSASPGAATINKPTGKSAVANGASSVVITNSLVAAASRVMVTFHADPGSRYWVVPGAGSFTVNLSSAATADVAFSWEVSNII